ncbi:MAG: hypothetical protein JSS27_01115 [Planctomycetes bacterium]|nr:hypothetical protein [Planctomycetota bacterium]
MNRVSEFAENLQFAVAMSAMLLLGVLLLLHSKHDDYSTWLLLFEMTLRAVAAMMISDG